MAVLLSCCSSSTPACALLMRVTSSYSSKLSCCFVRSFSSSSSSVFAGRRFVGTPVFSSSSAASSSSSALSSRIAGSQKRRSTAPGYLSFTMDATSTGASASAAEVAKKSIYDFVVKVRLRYSICLSTLPSVCDFVSCFPLPLQKKLLRMKQEFWRWRNKKRSCASLVVASDVVVSLYHKFLTRSHASR